MNTNEQKIFFKKLTLFFIAAVSLLFAGVFSNTTINYTQLFILFASSLCGVFIIYRVNDLIDHNQQLKFKTKQFLLHKEHIIVSVLLLFIIPFALLHLSSFSFLALALTAILGVGYSVTLSILGRKFRIKNIFLLKNISIGLAWGMLVLIGAGNIQTNHIIALFGLATLQVFIGSMIRDIPDVEKDQKEGVQSMPVVAGIRNTILFMHVANITSVFFLIIDNNPPFRFVLFSVMIWRFFNLFFLSKHTHSYLWSQTINLLTCTVFLVAELINYYADLGVPITAS